VVGRIYPRYETLMYNIKTRTVGHGLSEEVYRLSSYARRDENGGNLDRRYTADKYGDRYYIFHCACRAEFRSDTGFRDWKYKWL